MGFSLLLIAHVAVACCCKLLFAVTNAFAPYHVHYHTNLPSQSVFSTISYEAEVEEGQSTKQKICIIGAGWGGLSAAHALATSNQSSKLDITLVDASPRVGGLVRDGFTTINGTAKAEAGQHGFWDNYHNIFQLLEELPTIDNVDDVLTGYAEQGQYSPRGLEAVWPIYREMQPQLPTGLAQALYTKFINLSPLDKATALPCRAAVFC